MRKLLVFFLLLGVVLAICDNSVGCIDEEDEDIFQDAAPLSQDESDDEMSYTDSETETNTDSDDDQDEFDSEYDSDFDDLGYRPKGAHKRKYWPRFAEDEKHDIPSTVEEKKQLEKPELPAAEHIQKIDTEHPDGSGNQGNDNQNDHHNDDGNNDPHQDNSDDHNQQNQGENQNNQGQEEKPESKDNCENFGDVQFYRRDCADMDGSPVANGQCVDPKVVFEGGQPITQNDLTITPIVTSCEADKCSPPCNIEECRCFHNYFEIKASLNSNADVSVKENLPEWFRLHNKTVKIQMCKNTEGALFLAYEDCPVPQGSTDESVPTEPIVAA